MAITKIAIATVGITFAVASIGQSGAQLGGPEADAVAPAATPPAAATGATGPADHAKGREMFDTWGCGGCHVLAAADASGHVGPSLDGNPNLTAQLVTDRVTNGQGPMPAFGGMMNEQEIAQLTAYIVDSAKK
jgi:mono/diheme cytochrome c family protein